MRVHNRKTTPNPSFPHTRRLSISDFPSPVMGKGIVMIAHKDPMDGLNVEEVGGQRERPERPKAHSLGHRPRNGERVCPPCRGKSIYFLGLY